MSDKQSFKTEQEQAELTQSKNQPMPNITEARAQSSLCKSGMEPEILLRYDFPEVIAGFLREDLFDKIKGAV